MLQQSPLLLLVHDGKRRATETPSGHERQQQHAGNKTRLFIRNDYVPQNDFHFESSAYSMMKYTAYWFHEDWHWSHPSYKIPTALAIQYANEIHFYTCIWWRRGNVVRILRGLGPRLLWRAWVPYRWRRRLLRRRIRWASLWRTSWGGKGRRSPGKSPSPASIGGKSGI